MTRRLAPDALGPAIGYSHGIQANGLVFIAGQVGGEPTGDGGFDIVDGGLVPQFETALSNLSTVLEAAGASPDDLVDMTVFVTDIEAYRSQRKALGEVWRRVLGKRYPAMALVEVRALFDPEAMVEVKAIAVVDEDAPPDGG